MLGAIGLGLSAIGTVGSLVQGNKAGQNQQAALQSQSALSQEQAARDREMLAYFNSTFKPAEMSLIGDVFGFDPSSLKQLEMSPEDKAKVSELENLIKQRTDWISGTTSRKNQPSRDLWNSEISKARAELERLTAPKYDKATITKTAQQQATEDQLANIDKLAAADPEIKAALDGLSGASTVLNNQTQAGLSKLNSLAAANPEIRAGLQRLSEMTRGPASARDFLDESRKDINYYESNPLKYETEAGRAAAEVQQGADREREAAARRMLSRGVNPNSGAALEFDRLAGLQTSANKVFASNSARDVARTGAYGRKLTDYQRRIQGMGLANDANQSEFSRTGTLVDANRAYDMDQFNKGTTVFNSEQNSGQQDFTRKGAILDAMRGVGTDNFNKATSAFNLNQGANQQAINNKLNVLSLGRGLTSSAGLNSAAQTQGNIATSYGNSAGNWGGAAGNFANIGLNIADKAGWFDKPKDEDKAGGLVWA